jgi:two-component sensor histidine kinase
VWIILGGAVSFGVGFLFGRDQGKQLAITKSGRVSTNRSMLISGTSDISQPRERVRNHDQLLLQEIHHRVKNNLQVICSLLRLQSGYLPEGEARLMFRKSEERVKCIALVHDKLCRSESVSQVSFHEYVADLVRQLVRTYGIEVNQVSVDLDTIQLSVDKAVPLGLILNELISNALQHGRSADGTFSICVQLRCAAHGIVATVVDHGPGLPERIDPLAAKSLGLRVVQTLCKQLNAKLATHRDGGTAFTLEVPLESSDAATIGPSAPVQPAAVA